MPSLSKSLCYVIIALSVGVKAQDAPAHTYDYEPAARSKSKVATTWYAGWHADAVPPYPLSNVSWDLYTHITYSFAVTTPDVDMVTLNGSNPELLPQFVSEARRHGVSALVSMGGWTGSRWFSSNVATAENRTKFANTVLNFARMYQLDGIDFDWEYPGKQGIGCNVVSPSDSENFLSFLQVLRADPLGAKLTLSAAVAITSFAGPDGNPMTDVSDFAKVLDWIAIMNYDIWGPWSPTVGPNAPLDDSCAGEGNQFGSAITAVNQWNKAGMPLDQIVLAVPGYGHSYRVRKADAFVNGTQMLALHAKFDANDRPVGDTWDDGAGPDECEVNQPPGGTMDFWALVQQGYLTEDGLPASDRPYLFDNCSQTPFVYDPDREIMISYDNAESFTAKGKFIKSKDLRGFSLWEAGGDYNGTLVKSIRQNAGFC